MPVRSVVICEKGSQARNIIAAVGTSYGEVLAARGHLLRLMQPEEQNPEWKVWSTALLRPASGRYGLVPDTADGKIERLNAIGAAVRRADTVILATDCDREGQAIGENILRHFDFKGKVLRAIFTAEDEQTITKAFRDARPNEEFRSLYEAASARQQADQIFNLSLTRAATVSLVPQGVKAVVGLGRVKTPTMAIVCQRERELRAFAPRDYFELAAHVSCRGMMFMLTHNPAGEERIFDRRAAEEIAERLKPGWTGPISVVRERKHLAPPRPLDLPALQAGAASWGWSARKTLEITEALYATHKIVTYPRTATRYLPEALISRVPDLLAGLAEADLSGKTRWDAPCIREGKSGVFCDAELSHEPHHAIIPNPAVAGELAGRLARLSPDERRLFERIARSFAACVAPDHIYDRMAVTIDLPSGGKPTPFIGVGRTVVEPGWKAVARGGAGADKELADVEPALPDLKHGDIVSIDRIAVETKTTTPPDRYTEGSLVSAMRNAWKFVSDPGEQARLRDAKGIGTPATRDTVIEGLKAQHLVEVNGGKLSASEAAMQLFDFLEKRCPSLIDAGATARMEERLDEVVRGDVTADAVIDHICANAARLIEQLSAGGGSMLHMTRAPAPGMIEAARRKARREGKRLSKDVIEDYGKCRAYLGPLPEHPGGPGQPSVAQLALADRLAARSGEPVPEVALHDAARLSDWIGAHNPATERQLGWIARLVEDHKVQPPAGFPDKVSFEDARRVLDRAAKAKKSDGGRQRSRPTTP